MTHSLNSYQKQLQRLQYGQKAKATPLLIFMVTIKTKCGYHSNQLFLSLLSRPTYHVVGKIRPRTMFIATAGGLINSRGGARKGAIDVEH